MTRTTRLRRRGTPGLTLLAAAGIGIAVWQLQGTSAQAEAAPNLVTATRGDLIVSVGGVGRVVQARASSQLVLPGGSGASAPADAVFPHTTARVSKILVSAGQAVEADQAVAILNDSGTTAAAIQQAESDLTTAQLELRQKQISDPQKGVPATATELTAAQRTIESARARLASLLGPARATEVRLARVDLKRAEADLEVARGGSAVARANAIGLARQSIRVAQKRLEQALAPANPADVAAAQADVKKAQADLAVLKRVAPAPLGPVVKAAEQAVALAQQRLERLTGPPDAAAVKTAEAEVKRAEADLAALLRRPDPPVTRQEVEAANAAIEAARLRLAKLTGPPDPAEVSAAVLELNKALADLALLLQPTPDPLPEAVAAAQLAVDAARLRLKRLFAPPRSADVETARLELARARADLRTLQAGPSSAAEAAAQEAVNAARAKLAQLQGPAVSVEVTAARLDVSKAESEMAVLRARGGPASATDIELAQTKVAAAEKRLDAARIAQDDLTVRAPSAGVVSALLTVPGAPVDPTTPLLAVSDLESLAVNVDLSEFDVAQVRKGMKATVEVDALGGEAFPGVVRFVSLIGSDAAGVVNFPVRVSLVEPDGVKPGMNVSVRIIVAHRKNVVQVPLEAVTGEDEEATVHVLSAEGEPLPRKVKLGLSNNKNVEIRKGLRAGERVVLPEPDAAAGEE